MNILVLAPQPFFEERGTPIAVQLLCCSLVDAGHAVTLLTYAAGDPFEYPGVTHLRASSWPHVPQINPGFSLKKIYLDLFLAVKALRLVQREAFQVIHAVEESSFIAWVLSSWTKVPFVVDVDSSMSQQLVDKFGFLRPLKPVLDRLEAAPQKRSLAAVAMCESLASQLRHNGCERVFVLKDVSLLEAGTAPPLTNAEREACHPPGTEFSFMYIGNLESYQGVDLMLEGFAQAVREEPGLALIIIGGKSAHLDHYKGIIARLGIAAHCQLLGPKPVAQLQSFMNESNAMVSPRIHGTNTPMKLYSYLDSGRVVLATNLPTHTQVVNDQHCLLFEPDASAMAAAMLAAYRDPVRAAGIAQRAKRLIAQDHSLASFRRDLGLLYAQIDAAIAQRRSPE